MSGLLGGFMQGVGGAMQQNAQMGMDERRTMRLEELRNKYATQRQESDHQFRREERVEGQEFAAGQKDLDRSQQRELADMRERGADRRTGMQIASQDRRNLVQGVDEAGNTAWFNPTTGQQVNAPRGFQVPREGPDARGDDWSRQRYEIQWLRDDIEDLEERLAMGGATGAERQALQDDLDRKRREMSRLRQHSTGRTSAGPAGRDRDEGGSRPLSLEAFLGR